MKLFRVVSIAMLIAVCGVQWWSLRKLKTELVRLESRGTIEAARLVRLQFSDERRDELRRVVAWLDAFEHAPEALGRPGGMCIDNHIDMVAVEYLLDPYLRLRVDGASEEAARQKIADLIKETPEWQQRHRSMR